MAFIAKLSATFSFEAAHRMPDFPEGHPNSRIHGHSYAGEIIIEGPVDMRSGFVMSHAQLSEVSAGVLRRLDHRYLNDIPGLENPSGEHIARWIWNELRGKVPGLREVVLRRPTCGIMISYSGQEIPDGSRS